MIFSSAPGWIPLFASTSRMELISYIIGDIDGLFPGFVWELPAHTAQKRVIGRKPAPCTEPEYLFRLIIINRMKRSVSWRECIFLSMIGRNGRFPVSRSLSFTRSPVPRRKDRHPSGSTSFDLPGFSPFMTPAPLLAKLQPHQVDMCIRHLRKNRPIN